MKINNLLNQKQSVSFEFFPPRNDDMAILMHKTIDKLSVFDPDFISITYGAGGTKNSTVLNWVLDFYKKYTGSSTNVMMHLTCRGNTKKTIDETCEKLLETGIYNLLVLRGDLPVKGDTISDFKYASDLVKYIKKKYPSFSIGVAGYPEKHTEAASINEDILNLKYKVDCGADFIITQLFFNNDFFYDYMDHLIALGINCPVLAGIMPIINSGQINKFVKMCGVSVPKKLVDEINKVSEEEIPKIGEEHAYKQINELVNNNVKGIHFYTLNKYPTIYNVLNRIKAGN